MPRLDPRDIRLAGDGLDNIRSSAAARRLLQEGGWTGEALEIGACTLLTGHYDDAMRERLRSVAAEMGEDLPPGFDVALAYYGIDHVAMLALSQLATRNMLGVRRADDEVNWISHVGLQQQDHTWVELVPSPAPGITSGITLRESYILMPRVPETIAALLPGRPLSDLIDHPALASLTLTIVAIEDCWENDSLMEVVTSIHKRRQECAPPSCPTASTAP